MGRWVIIFLVLGLVGAMVGLGSGNGLGSSPLELGFYVLLGTAVFLFLGDLFLGREPLPTPEERIAGPSHPSAHRIGQHR